ncbi:MAG: hypothetical protein ABR499_21095 [Gemmatimonadaceae bacterium]
MKKRRWTQVGILALGVATALGCTRAATVQSESAGTLEPVMSTGVTPVNARTLPAGVDLELTLDQAIGTKNSRVGQEFSATVRNTVHAQNGRVVVPAGAKVYGRVTGLDDSDHPGEAAAIRLDFDRLVFNGRSYPFEARITATQLERSQDRNVSGRDVAIGAAAGAALGAIIGEGDLKKILGGAAIGAAAGTVIALGAGDTEATLPAGARMNVRTTQTVALR